MGMARLTEGAEDLPAMSAFPVQVDAQTETAQPVCHSVNEHFLSDKATRDGHRPLCSRSSRVVRQYKGQNVDVPAMYARLRWSSPFEWSIHIQGHASGYE